MRRKNALINGMQLSLSGASEATMMLCLKGSKWLGMMLWEARINIENFPGFIFHLRYNSAKLKISRWNWIFNRHFYHIFHEERSTNTDGPITIPTSLVIILYGCAPLALIVSPIDRSLPLKMLISGY